MRSALRAEWTKLWTITSPLWLLLGTIALTVASSVVLTSVVSSVVSSDDATELSLTGVVLGQALVVILAVLVISDEYGTGMVRTTLAATPHRATVLAAKAAAVTGVVTTAGSVAVLGALTAGRLILPGRGCPAISLTDGATLRATVGSIVDLDLIAVLSLGVATVVRDAATSIGIVLGLLYLFPLLAQAVGDPRWQRLLEQIGPTTAGLGVLIAWAAAALVAGALLLQLRDA